MAESNLPYLGGNKRVFVGNLDYQVSPDTLEQEMSVAGRVTSCDIPHDSSGRPRGYAVVEFETCTAARIAIETLRGLELNGRAITLREDRGKREKVDGPSTANTQKPFAPNDASDSSSRRQRRSNRGRRDYGDGAKGMSSGSGGSRRSEPRSKRTSRKIPNTPRVVGKSEGKTKGMTSSSSSSRLTDTSKNFESKQNVGRKRQLQRPRIKLDENLQGRLVYYGNLSWSANVASVSEFVGGLSCIIPTDHRGRSKGYALVEYSTDTEALDAVSKYSETEFFGRRLIARLFVFKSSSSSASAADRRTLGSGVDSAESSSKTGASC